MGYNRIVVQSQPMNGVYNYEMQGLLQTLAHPFNKSSRSEANDRAAARQAERQLQREAKTARKQAKAAVKQAKAEAIASGEGTPGAQILRNLAGAAGNALQNLTGGAAMSPEDLQLYVDTAPESFWERNKSWLPWAIGGGVLLIGGGIYVMSKNKQAPRRRRR